MSKKRILICDDEIEARQLIRTRLKNFSQFEIVGEAVTGDEAIKLIKNLKPHLVFLDIDMPLSTGLQVFEKIGLDNMPPTIFVTAYSEHATKAFELYAVDYLLKPYSKERFELAIKRVEKRISSQGNQIEKIDYKSFFEFIAKANLPYSLETNEIEQDKYLQRITIETVLPWVILKAEDIEFITAEDHYVRITTRDSSYLIPGKISGFENQLDPAVFFRAHRSQIVNISKVAKVINGKFGTLELIISSEKRIKVSRNRKKLCQLVLTKWLK